ncbi:UNVERIFIED_CONTAM: hypothetical protein FKN15_052523 [Acipenser sinensis]
MPPPLSTAPTEPAQFTVPPEDYVMDLHQGMSNVLKAYTAHYKLFRQAAARDCDGKCPSDTAVLQLSSTGASHTIVTTATPHRVTTGNDHCTVLQILSSTINCFPLQQISAPFSDRLIIVDRSSNLSSLRYHQCPPNQEYGVLYFISSGYIHSPSSTDIAMAHQKIVSMPVVGAT